MLTGMAHSDWRLNARDVADHGISRSRPTTSTQLKMRVPTIDQMNISLESRPTAIRQFGKSTNCYSYTLLFDFSNLVEFLNIYSVDFPSGDRAFRAETIGHLKVIDNAYG